MHKKPSFTLQIHRVCFVSVILRIDRFHLASDDTGSVC